MRFRATCRAWLSAAVAAAALSSSVAVPGAAWAAAPQDLGDAPFGFDIGDNGPARATIGGPRLGSAVTADALDPDTGASVHASESATGDAGDDAVSGFAPLRTGRLLTFSADLAVTQVSAPARVCGWVDFDLSGSFTEDERACVTVAAGATTARLSWTGLPADAGPSYVRLRIGTTSAQVERADGLSDSGEVEDYPLTFQPPAPTAQSILSLTKSAAPSTVSAVGQVVTYTFKASNIGQTPLTDVRVRDELPGLSAPTCDGPAALAVGQSLACTATRRTTQADLDFGSVFNFAQASGEGPGGDTDDDSDDVTALDDATVAVKAKPALRVVSRSSRSALAKGNRVTWTFTATNTGNLTLTGVRITTSLKGLSKLTCKPKAGSTLAPKATMVCSGSYTVTKGDASKRSLTVKGTARGEAPYGDTTRTSDDVTSTVTKTLKVKKAVVARGAAGIQPASTTSPSGGLADTGGVNPYAALGFAALALAGAALIGLGRRRHS